MSKDPAFLLYSQAFYESTRLMLPEERACFLDLLIYQHQNGEIPLDTSRMHLYCTGVVNQVVNQVLNDKFVKTETGWVNKKMCSIVEERKKINPKKVAYATLAGLLSASNLSKTQAEKIKKQYKVDDYSKLPADELKNSIKEWFYSLVNGFVNNNKDKDKSKDLIKAEDQNEDEEEKPKFTSLDFKQKLLDLGAKEIHVDDWLKARRKKRAVNSQTALTTFLNECNNNNFPVADAVKACAENSWSGFKYQWLLNEANQINKNGKSEPTINRQSAATIKQNSQGW